MSDKRIVYTRPDGGVCVVSPAPALIMEFHLLGMATGTLHWQGTPLADPDGVVPLAEAEALATAFVRAKDVPVDAANVAVCEMAVLPTSRRFRDCWRQAGAAIPHVDLPLARTQRMNETRKERVLKLTKSDVDLLKAQESGNTALQTQLKDYRQALRDVPQTQQVNVDACTTPEQLEAWVPQWPSDPAL